MKQQYLNKKKGAFDVRYLPQSEFKFTTVDLSIDEPVKAEKTKKEKKPKKDGMRPPRDGKMPSPPRQ